MKFGEGSTNITICSLLLPNCICNGQDGNAMTLPDPFGDRKQLKMRTLSHFTSVCLRDAFLVEMNTIMMIYIS